MSTLSERPKLTPEQNNRCHEYFHTTRLNKTSGITRDGGPTRDITKDGGMEVDGKSGTGAEVPHQHHRHQ